MTEAELRERLATADTLPYGAGRIAAVEEVVRHADAAGLAPLAFEARLELVAAYEHGGEEAKAFVPFARCLAEYDRDPTGKPSWSPQLLCWQYKWIVTNMLSFPNLGLDQINAALDDLAKRLPAAGLGERSLHMLRFEVADFLGDAEQAEHWFTLWRTTPRDANSDCPACEAAEFAVQLGRKGSYEEALRIAEPVLADSQGCVENPARILTALLPVFVATGAHDDARWAHLRAYRQQRTNRNNLGDIADQIAFCARTGNEARGLELLERHLPWADHAPTPRRLMEFHAAAALLLRRLTEAGHGGLPVRRPADGSRPASTIRVSELAGECAAAAMALAAEFDTRNGTDHQTQRIAALIAAEPWVESLPLAPGPSRLSTAARPAPADPELASVDLSELAARAERLALRRRTVEAAAAYDAFLSRTAGRSLDAALAARRAEFQAARYSQVGRETEALDRYREAVEGYSALGDEARRRRALAQAGRIRYERGDDTGLIVVLEAAEYFASHEEPLYLLDALLRLALSYGHHGGADKALSALDDADAVAASIDDAALAVHLDCVRGQILLRANRADQAREPLERARERAQAEGFASDQAYAAYGLSFLRAQSDDQAGARELLDEALRVAPAGTDPGFLGQVRAARGHLRADTGDQQGAAEDLAEALHSITAAQRPWTRRGLAISYLQLGRDLEAAEQLEEAFAELPESAEAAVRIELRYLLGQVQARLGEADPALEHLTACAEYFAGHDEHLAVARASALCGDLLYEMRRPAEAAERYATAGAAFDRAEEPPDAARSFRRQARALLASGRQQQALDLLLGEATTRTNALTAGPECDPVWERADLADDLARAHADLGQHAEALACAEAAENGYAEAGDRYAAGQSALLRGQILLDLPASDRRDEAAPVLERAAGHFTEVGAADVAEYARSLLETESSQPEPE